MKNIYIRLLLCVCVVSLLLQMSGVSIQGQQPTQKKTQPEPQKQSDDDTIRISTELVQTGVSVFDKKGNFVEGLNKEDFELKVDGNLVDVGFFERIAAGSAREAAPIVTPRSDSTAKVTAPVKDTDKNRGRTIVFFVDDIHIAFDSLKRAKDDIIRFIDREMGQNDLVAIASSSGQVGFLQQYTDNKDVLRLALSRLSYRNYGTRDTEAPTMTDGQAVLINQGYKVVLDFFITQTMGILSVPRPTAEQIVRRRARILALQSAGYSKATLSTLETLARSAAGLPGRKLVFFYSDGFPMDARDTDAPERLRRIADASIRSGVIIYTMDARGLVTDMMDATVDSPASGHAGSLSREVGMDVLNTLAADTGGRFIHNTNGLGLELTKALKETSVYYLLAWRPVEEQSSKKFRRIKVRIKNRPELSVRVQRGYFDVTPEADQARNAKTATPDPLRKAIDGLVPKREIPTRLALTYIDTTVMGSSLVASMKVEADALTFVPQGGAPAASVDIAGTVLDAKGKALDSFSHRLTVRTPASGQGKAEDILFNYRASLKPGFYQVRVGAIDRASGHTGSAMEWVEIPDLAKQGLSLSSLMIGERKVGPSEEENNSDALVGGFNLSVDRKFERSSNLRYLIYVYDAPRTDSTAGKSPTNVTLQAQIFSGDQLVVAMPPRQLSTELQEPTHSYAAEFPLQGLRAGQYVLQLTAIDRTTNALTSQSVRFEVQ